MVSHFCVMEEDLPSISQQKRGEDWLSLGSCPSDSICGLARHLPYDVFAPGIKALTASPSTTTLGNWTP